MSKVEGKVWKYNYVLHSNPPDISDLEDLLFQGGEFPGYITKSNSPELNRVYIWEGRKK